MTFCNDGDIHNILTLKIKRNVWLHCRIECLFMAEYKPKLNLPFSLRIGMRPHWMR